jgi:hypothetical protein
MKNEVQNNSYKIISFFGYTPEHATHASWRTCGFVGSWVAKRERDVEKIKSAQVHAWRLALKSTKEV